MIRYIDGHRNRVGVEPICEVLQVAPSTYYSARKRPPCRRQIIDDRLTAEIRRVFEDNYAVYGVRKVWRQLNREGVVVARCTVERLMRQMGLAGRVRGKRRRTTLPADLAAHNAMAESVIGLYKSELMVNRGPWRTEDVELATLALVHWWNTARLHSAIDNVPQPEFEAAHYAQQQPALTAGDH